VPFPKIPFVGLAIVVAILLIPMWVWYFWRIEPGAGEFAVLIRKTGRDLPSGQILALGPGQKGIQLDVLTEGRYFRNPYTWGWRIVKALDIPAGKLGVQTRLFGDDLPPGRILAGDGTKGILSETLGPGRHRVNPFAYHVELFDAINIRPGHVGVKTSLVGKDVLGDRLADAERNTLLVGPGLKGVLPEVMDPGTYYLNPYIVSVAEVNLQSQRFEMGGEDVISFLTMDGFNVTVEGTIEYSLARDKAALITHRVGDMPDIIKKLIMPRARGFSRVEGSKHPAIDFIVGETRQQFQKDLDTHLRERSRDWGVEIKSVLVRKISVPDEIASISREREVAVQDALKFEQQIAQAKSEAELRRQEMLAQQNKEKVEADTIRIRSVINAQQDQSVKMIAAQRELEVARIERQAAEFKAAAVLLRADGERAAIEARNRAEADVLGAQVAALGGGLNLARFAFYQQIAPRVESVLSGDQEGGLGMLFVPFLPDEKKGVTP
jgi:regulator of protease activity HflC (stomatin/prohibitin superfamily)